MQGQNTPANLVDGDPFTVARTNSAAGEFLQIDLGELKSVEEIQTTISAVADSDPPLTVSIHTSEFVAGQSVATTASWLGQFLVPTTGSPMVSDTGNAVGRYIVYHSTDVQRIQFFETSCLVSAYVPPTTTTTTSPSTTTTPGTTLPPVVGTYNGPTSEDFANFANTVELAAGLVVFGTFAALLTSWGKR